MCVYIYIQLYYKPYLRNMNGHNNFLSNDDTSIERRHRNK